MCLYPNLIQNKKYIANKKNGGNIPPINDERVKWVPVGCGECMECRKQYGRAWQVRLLEDVRHNRNGKFVTLTFSNESITELVTEIRKKHERIEGYKLDNAIATLAVHRWRERWRKKYKKSPRHWLITELGHEGTKNIHMHGIVWTDESLQEIENIWGYGITWKPERNWVNEQTVNYLIKYVNKVDHEHRKYKQIVLTSPGIGKGYIERPDSTRNKYKGEDTIEHYRTRTGHKIAMPTYWRNKIYTEEEREKLWLQRLDKQERWVNGIRVDVSQNDDEYWATVKEERYKNKRLGYGDGEKDWDRKRYENEKRKIMLAKRMSK